jgi:hypothetical protein
MRSTYTELGLELEIDCAGIPDFEPACIAQLIQVEQCRRRFADANSGRPLCQIPSLWPSSVYSVPMNYRLFIIYNSLFKTRNLATI